MGGWMDGWIAERRRELGYCVTMQAQVVAFQAMMELMAKEFPEALSGYTLEVVESHQATKIDTSGTAKAIVQSFQRLGCKEFTVRRRRVGREQRQQSVSCALVFCFCFDLSPHFRWTTLSRFAMSRANASAWASPRSTCWATPITRTL